MSARNVHELLTAAWQYPNSGPGERLTLIVLIEHMGLHDGEWLAWPGTRLLASETLQSEGTIRRHLAALEADGLLSTRRRPRSEGRGSLVSEIVLDYDVLTNRSRCADGPTTNRASSHDQPRIPATTNRASGQIAPITELPEEPTAGEPVEVAALPLGSLPPSAPTARTAERADAMADFELWWRAYPRSEDKGAARKAYMAALRRGATAAAMLAGAEMYRDDRRRKADFTKLPASWLNAESYDNEAPTGAPPPVVEFGTGVASFAKGLHG